MNVDKEEKYIKISKFMSFVLRHKPELIGIALDNEGWVNLDDFIHKINKHKNFHLTKETIHIIVKNDEKQRYSLSYDGSMIRANQGHSVHVDLKLQPEMPPVLLYHGTVENKIKSIEKEGLLPMSRNFVHLSSDIQTAENVGKRRGLPIILTIQAQKMHNEGYNFYLSENKIWLTKKVPVEYITLA
jgi:putative RNA 2'-phosphotransferase